MKPYIYNENGLYYFNLKGKGTFGPYVDEEAAEETAKHFKPVRKKKRVSKKTKRFFLTPEELVEKQAQYGYNRK